MESNSSNNNVSRLIQDILVLYLKDHDNFPALTWRQKIPEIHGRLADLAYRDELEGDPVPSVVSDIVTSLYKYPDDQIEIILQFLYSALKSGKFQELCPRC